MLKKVIKTGINLQILSFAILIFSYTTGYCQTNFTKYARLFILEDKGELKDIIDEAKKVINKKPEDKDALIKLGIAYHNLGDLGDKRAPDEAVKYLKKAHKLYPEDPLALAVLGSSTTMLGRYSKQKITEGRVLANKGGDLLDKAVASAPDDVLVRMVRAGNSRGEPKFFGRRHFYKEDLMHVNEIMERSKESEYPNEFRALIYYQLGDAYKLEKNESQAELYFKKAIKTDPDSMWAEKAKDEL
jgi:tetratricopeptide (TPR) repeat protein